MGSGYLLTGYTDAALPYLDSFTTWGAIITTWMVARKVLQNWHYWFVIDSVSVYLYMSRGLVLTALLFCVYLLLIILGYRAWRQSMGKPA
jgi:nicotinamide mononucleotide transporter